MPLRLTGIARAVGEPQLQQFVPAGGWRRVASVRPDADGAFTLLVRPKRTTRYRLVAAGVTGPPVTVRVAARARPGGSKGR